jgi:hypothetical protein
LEIDLFKVQMGAILNCRKRSPEYGALSSLLRASSRIVLKHRKTILIVLVLLAHEVPAGAQADSNSVDERLVAASRLIVDGKVKDGLDRMVMLMGQIDPVQERDAYWRTATTLIEFLSQVENHTEAGRIINILASTKIPEAQQAYYQWMQFYIGRNLAYTGHADEGVKFLRALTAGDARLVYIPAQRAAAVMLSKIELDRDDVSQAAIWIRRAVIGTLCDKGAASEEIVDVLTAYANFLMRTRRLTEAYYLLARLGDIYEVSFGHRSPKYLHFLSLFVATVATIGNFQHADAIQKKLSESVSSVDVVPASVREELTFQELYRLARVQSTDRLKAIVSNNPDLKRPHYRILASYLALLAGDLELAEKYFYLEMTSPTDAQFQAYQIILKSFFFGGTTQELRRVNCCCQPGVIGDPSISWSFGECIV